MMGIYITGKTPEGKPLIGGIWSLFHRDGFPLEMSRIQCESSGWLVDWIEACADASMDNNLPALVKHMESFMQPDDLTRVKARYGALLASGMSHEQILTLKKSQQS